MIPGKLLNLSPVSRLRRRCNSAVFVYYFIWSMTVAALLAGAFILTGKAFDESITGKWPWLALCIPVSAVISYILARPNFISEEKLLAIADERFHADGLLVTASEVELGPWAGKLEKTTEAERKHPALPRCNFRFMFSRLAPCVIFLSVTALIPQRIPPDGLLIDIKKHVANELENTLSALDEAGLIDPKLKEKIEEQIQALKDETEKQFGMADWEAADAIREMMKAEALGSAEDLRSAAEMAERAIETLDSAADGEYSGNGSDAESAEAAAEAIEKALTRLAERGALSNLSEEMIEKLGGMEALKQGTVRIPRDPEELRRLAEELQHEFDAMCQNANEGMKQAGIRGGMPGGDEGNFAMDSQDSEQRGEPGRGGISRGPGEAPMTWGQEGPHADLFKEMKLPPGYIVNPDGLVIRLGAMAPDDDPIAGVAGVAREFDPDSGLPAGDRRLSPRHRGIIKRYFEGDN